MTWRCNRDWVQNNTTGEESKSGIQATAFQAQPVLESDSRIERW